MTNAPTDSRPPPLDYASAHDGSCADSRDPANVVDPPASLGKALRQIGPGLILAGAIVGTGELIATTNLGAKVGFVLLWLVILSCFIKVFVQVELGRYTISSGDTTFAGFKRLPGPGISIAWWWVVMMLITQLQIGAMIGGVGQALHMAMPFLADWFGATQNPEIPWAAVTAVSTSLMLAYGGYRFIEGAMTLMVASFTIATVVCVALLPAAGHPIAWSDLASGLTFHLPPEAIAAAIAMFGITGVGATELISYPYWCIEKGYAKKVGPRDGSDSWVSRARGWMRIMRLDAWVSMLVYTLATIAFFILGAAVLHQPGNPNSGLPTKIADVLKSLAGMYEPVMGARWSLIFMIVGVIAVLYSTIFAATASNMRAMVDCFHVSNVIKLNSHADRMWWVTFFSVIFPIVDLFLYIWVKDAVKMVVIGGFMQAITLPMIGAAAMYLRYRHTDRRIRPTPLWDVFLWVSVAGLFGAAVIGIVDNLKKFM